MAFLIFLGLFAAYLAWSIIRLKNIKAKFPEAYFRERNRFLFTLFVYAIGLLFIFYREKERQRVDSVLSEGNEYTTCLRIAAKNREMCAKNTKLDACANAHSQAIQACNDKNKN